MSKELMEWVENAAPLMKTTDLHEILEGLLDFLLWAWKDDLINGEEYLDLTSEIAEIM